MISWEILGGFNMQIKIRNTSHHPLPKYETVQSAGMDLRAFLPDGPVTLKPMERGLVKTGLFMELPAGYEAQVRPRQLTRHHRCRLPRRDLRHTH